MDGQFSIYTRHPSTTVREYSYLASPRRVSRSPDAESDASQKARSRLYRKGSEEAAEKSRGRLMTKAEKQKLAQEKVLRYLMDPTFVDAQSIANLVSQWANEDFDIDPEVIRRRLAPAEDTVRTESIPEKNLFRIRIRVQGL
jgi:hypothetical protein